MLLQLARLICEFLFNDLESDLESPKRIRHADENYRRRGKSPNILGTLFGSITLNRYLYECLEPGEPCIFPLELDLGVEAGLATPALAERLGRLVADHEQSQVLRLLKEENNVSWSVDSLRKCSESLHEGLASFREPAQVAKLVEALKQAEKSAGPHRPTLTCGRDGVMIPIRKSKTGYREAATGTVSVNDCSGKRLATVYLGQMPEKEQKSLSEQLTSLLKAVLKAWKAAGGRVPRLSYVTDGGTHATTYYRTVLQKMTNPWREGSTLRWQWVIDFYHVCQYLGDLAEALFGPGREANCWYQKMRRKLLRQRNGITNVLRSASQHFNQRHLGRTRRKVFWKAYRYLRRRSAWMQYAKWRASGMPIGSGVTEAACKIVFAQRMKRSGMKWGHEGGQVVVGLRVLVLSKIWGQVFAARLKEKNEQKAMSSIGTREKPPQIAA